MRCWTRPAMPRAYATCLTKLAENKLVRRVTSLAPGFWQRHSELAGRVENILHRRRNLGPVFSRGLVAAGLVASLSGVLMLQRCPGLVTFAAQRAGCRGGFYSPIGAGLITINIRPTIRKQSSILR